MIENKQNEVLMDGVTAQKAFCSFVFFSFPPAEYGATQHYMVSNTKQMAYALYIYALHYLFFF